MPNNAINPIRPFLKWAGNKYNCLHHILETLPKASRFIEPFAGSGAVFINTHYPEYIIAEDNHDLINLFQHVKHEGDDFITFCETYFSDENNMAEKYYYFREEFNQCEPSRQRAALFLYLNRHGYNGLCRYNKQGKYNVPFGSYIKPLFPKERMQFFHKKTQNTVFKHSDFRKTFRLAKPGDLIYCDPPYAPRDQQSNFSSYTAKKFGEKEQIILAKLAEKAAKKGIMVIISNHDTTFTRNLYQHSEITSFPVARTISRNTHNRVPVQELLAIFRSNE